MSTEIQPVFDPSNPALILDRVQEAIPINQRWLKGLIPGETAAKRVGHGYEIDGIRDFMDGDDPRYVDWNVTARMTDEGATPQVRIHYRDITPNFWIVTDAAQSRYNIESPRDNPGHFPENLLALSAITALMR